VVDGPPTEGAIDFAAFERSLRRIGTGWLIAMVMIVTLGPFRPNLLVGGALAAGGLRRLKSARLGGATNQRADELVAFVYAAMGLHVVGVISGLIVLEILCNLLLLLAQLRFAVLMRSAMQALGSVRLAERWQAASRTLIVASGLMVALIVPAAGTAWIGNPAIEFVDRETDLWIMGRSAELTWLGVALLLVGAAAYIWQIVTLNRVFQPTRAWVEAHVARTTDTDQPGASALPSPYA
jgi:hypothetical protein